MNDLEAESKQFHHDYGMANGFAPIAHKVICIDFDSTLYPWGILFNWEAEPIPGAAECVRALKKAGYHIVILTSRMSPSWLEDAGESGKEHLDYIMWLLSKHGIPWDRITSEKVPAEHYVDDKAIEFTGNNWPEIQQRLLEGAE